MDFKTLKKESGNYKPAIKLDRLYPKDTRRKAKIFFGIVTAAIFILGITVSANSVLSGLVGISLSIWLIHLLLEFFYNSYYFRGIKSVLKSDKKISLIDYHLAELIYLSDEKDLTESFIKSRVGREILLRSSLPKKEAETFLSARISKVGSNSINLNISESNSVSLSDYVRVLLGVDHEFSTFLKTKSVSNNDVIGASNWCENIMRANDYKLRWWGQDQLAEVQGIAKNWAHGNTYYLDRFSHSLSSDQDYVSPDSPFFASKELAELETILSRSREANVILVSEKGAGAMSVIHRFSARVSKGLVPAPIEHKRVVELDTAEIMSAYKSKTDLEAGLILIFRDASLAGNIIMVIDDFPQFIKSARALGTEISIIMYPYLAGTNLQVIAVSDPAGYHEVILKNSAVSKRFENIIIEEIESKKLIEILEDEVIKIEKREKVFFTYQAVLSAVEGVEKYATGNISLEKTIDLLYEAVSWAREKGHMAISGQDMTSIIERKTGIRIQRPRGKEKMALLGLEKQLAKRVIGQASALSAVSRAILRSRGGIANPKKPIGSFLFLGPTGVGKTETTKALAESFFDSEEEITRFDMSEYQGGDALERLIGQVSHDKSGILSSRLRDKPYGILLLDEFEKTTKEVMNLFLQILDEGYFSDADGKKIVVRNMIIIATSNAAADMIWDLSEENESAQLNKKAIIDSIIRRGIFSPELLNRFDDVIIFNILSETELKIIARLMIDKLKKRVESQGIKLEMTEDLIDYLVKESGDRRFGARAINRIIQDRIEELIARRIISGETSAGGKLAISLKDIL